MEEALAGKRRNTIFPIDRGAPASVVADKFGGAAFLAKALGKNPSTVQRWIVRGQIDGKYHSAIIAAARREKVKIRVTDFIDTRPLHVPGGLPS